MASTKVLFAGFGGQGILFSGKFLVFDGLLEGKEVSWLPSYGPEMRGGTANCSVIIGDEPIGSPIVSKPDMLVVMNLPSYDKYEKDIVPGGYAFVDSSLIERAPQRDDITTVAIPATQIASENDIKGLANMIMLGKVIKETGIIDYDDVDRALSKIIPPRRQQLIEPNKKALDLGYNY